MRDKVLTLVPVAWQPVGFPTTAALAAVCRFTGEAVYTLGEAARASGKSKPTIAKAIKAGRISAARAEDGSYQIDPAELHRVYLVASQQTVNGLQNLTPADTPVATDGLPGELDKWRTLAIEREETIRDLRSRLDREVEERRHLLAMITDRRPWWRRWFR